MSNISYNPLYWQEMYSLELTTYKKNLERKCRSVIKWDNEVQTLMKDPILNEYKIKPLLAKIKYVSDDISLSQSLISAIEALTISFITTSVSLCESHKIREAKLYNNSLELAIKYTNAVIADIETEMRRRTNGS